MKSLIADDIRKLIEKVRTVAQNADSDEWQKFFNKVNANLEFQARIIEAVNTPEGIKKQINKLFGKGKKDE